MNSTFGRMIILGGGLAVAAVGCGRQADANKDLAQAERSLATADSSPVPAAAPPQPDQPPPPAPAAPAPAPAQQINQAAAAFKAGNLEDAVTRLQKLRSTPTLTPQQRMALNDAIASVMAEVYALAAKGDSRAIQAVKQYEQMQTQRR